MGNRVNFLTRKNGGVERLGAVSAWLADNFDHKLLELVKLRVSQMNGCAFCLHMYRLDALKLGETEDRIILLSAWRESALFTDRERTALAWAETLTNIADGHAPEDAYEEALSVFSEEELIALSIGIATINAWNRLAIGFRVHHPADHAPQA